ncbi:MAG: serine/threonine-protein kinase [Myxococcota bacterium]
MNLPANRQHTIRGLSPGTRLGRHVVVRRLGSGGMAELYLSRLDGPEGFVKPVALKLMHPHLSDDAHFARMFLKEARIAATLEHPSIVQVLDVGEFGGEYFMALEYVHGRDLRRILADQKGKPPPLGCALRIVLEIGRALHYAHRLRDSTGRGMGIVHRDVSPSNVLISYQGAVKLADFGVAKVVERSTATASGSLKGKMGYMSPEQCLQEHVDARSDVFALGVVLYETTTARRAFRGEQPVAVMNDVIDGVWKAPSELVSDYPSRLQQIVTRALEVDVEKRYASAEAMVEEIEAFAREAGIDTRVEVLAEFLSERYGQPALPDLEVEQPEAPQIRSLVAEMSGQAPIVEGPAANPSRRWVTGLALMGVLALGGLLGWQAGRSSDDPAASDRIDARPAPVQDMATAVPPNSEAAVVEPAVPVAVAKPGEAQPTKAPSVDPTTETPTAATEPAEAAPKPKAKRRRRKKKPRKTETERAREILFPGSP